MTERHGHGKNKGGTFPIAGAPTMLFNHFQLGDGTRPQWVRECERGSCAVVGGGGDGGLGEGLAFGSKQ